MESQLKPGLARKRRGFATRIVTLSLALLLVVQLAVFGVVRATIEQSARRQIADELSVGARVWSRLLQQNAQKLSLGAGLLAGDYGFRSAASSGDLQTIQSVLSNHGARIGATITALFDVALNLQAVAEGQDAQKLAYALNLLIPILTKSPSGGQIAMVDGLPHQFVIAPVRSPTVIGYVLMGFPMGQSLVDEMKTLSDMNVVLLGPARNGVQQLVAGTMAPDALSSDFLAQKQDSIHRIAPEIVYLKETLVGRAVQLKVVNGSVTTWLFQSLDKVAEPFRQAQYALAWITLFGVFLFGLGSVLLARHVTTPLRALVSGARKIALGDYNTPLAHTATNDEVGELSNAFDQMRISIGRQQAEIRDAAYRDRLTGLPNRAQFHQTLARAIAYQADKPAAVRNAVAVLVLDLNRFKVINDVLGYEFGDQVLHGLALQLTQRLALAVQGEVAQGTREMQGAALSSHLLARLGGNTFAVLWVAHTVAEALEAARSWAAFFDDPQAIGGQTIDLSASMGVACWPAHAGDAYTLLNRAEVAMYAAKRQSHAVVLYDASLDGTGTATLSLLGELRHALSSGELRLYLQPKIRQLHSEPHAAEALIRWQHPVRGLMPPVEFVPFAEQTGFVRQLTIWVFTEVARQWHNLQQANSPLSVAVNLSARDLMDQDFPSRLQSILRQFNVPERGICLEITESAMMDDAARAQATLDHLHTLGFALSIDDFGTGYSSLAYLKALPVSQLKIDKSFVMGMAQDQSAATIVRSTIDLAHNLGLEVVAEGVEDVATYNLLKQLGCDEAQGYFIGRPMPLAEFGAWRSKWVLRIADNRRDFGQSIPMPMG